MHARCMRSGSSAPMHDFGDGRRPAGVLARWLHAALVTPPFKRVGSTLRSGSVGIVHARVHAAACMQPHRAAAEWQRQRRRSAAPALRATRRTGHSIAPTEGRWRGVHRWSAAICPFLSAAAAAAAAARGGRAQGWLPGREPW
eukprot:365582-Chlamydomonas_euryale.AAC.2